MNWHKNGRRVISLLLEQPNLSFNGGRMNGCRHSVKKCEPIPDRKVLGSNNGVAYEAEIHQPGGLISGAKCNVNVNKYNF